MSISPPPLNRMLVNRRVTPSIKFAGTYLYTRVERDTVRVKCLVQEYNPMAVARTWTWAAPWRVECRNLRPPRLPLLYRGSLRAKNVWAPIFLHDVQFKITYYKSWPQPGVNCAHLPSCSQRLKKVNENNLNQLKTLINFLPFRKTKLIYFHGCCRSFRAQPLS